MRCNEIAPWQSFIPIACGAIDGISSAKFPKSQANKPKTQVSLFKKCEARFEFLF
jgi:hypothetical protein